jgi:redox-sensitive bicupin YhaK (pirin superfamily)
MMTIRPAGERGHAQHGWLDSHHTFSFADYYDEAHMGFRSLRVINEDRVAPAQGFGTHPHRDMEIISYVLEGGLEHKDSMGTGSVIKPGDVQRMSAGTGVRHSEKNASNDEGVHFLQIWIMPEKRGIDPSYEQKSFPLEERKGKLRLLASRDGREGTVTIHQDAAVYGGVLDRGEAASFELKPSRQAWVHLARGSLSLNGQALGPGDGAAVSGESKLELVGQGGPAEVLVFDLP